MPTIRSILGCVFQHIKPEVATIYPCLRLSACLVKIYHQRKTRVYLKKTKLGS